MTSALPDFCCCDVIESSRIHNPASFSGNDDKAVATFLRKKKKKKKESSEIWCIEGWKKPWVPPKNLLQAPGKGEGKVGLATAGSQTVYDRFLIFDVKKDLKTKNYNPISEVSLIYIKTI